MEVELGEENIYEWENYHHQFVNHKILPCSIQWFSLQPPYFLQSFGIFAKLSLCFCICFAL